MSARAYARVFVALFAGGVLLTATTHAQITWYVDDDANPNGDGMSWTSTFNDLQDALDAASYGHEAKRRKTCRFGAEHGWRCAETTENRGFEGRRNWIGISARREVGEMWTNDGEEDRFGFNRGTPPRYDGSLRIGKSDMSGHGSTAHDSVHTHIS